jgi:tRNA pseudouridine55 synthase
VVEFHLGARKAYRATVCFGASSTTDDLEGELTPSEGPAPSREVVEAALAGFLGTHLQLPPAFSARKVGGRRAYALARAGHAPELPARETTFHALSLERWDGTDPDCPLAVIDVSCSAGTYVRALARDLGRAVGSAAYLGALRRTAAGPFTLDDAISLDVAREAAAGGRFADLLRPVGTGLDELPALTLRPDEVVVVAHGGWIGEGGRLPAPSGIPADGPVAGAVSSAAAVSSAGADRVRLLLEDGSLAAIARRAGGRLVPDKVLVPRAGAATHG